MRISNIINFIISSFGLAWMPIVFNSYTKPKVKEFFNNVFKLYIYIGCYAIFGIYIFREELLQFLAPNYLESMDLITLLLIYNFVMGFNYVFTIGIQITKNTKVITTAAIFAISTNIIMSIFLVNDMGIEGIAIGSLLGAFLWIIIQHIYSQKYYKIKYSYLTLIMTIVILMFCILFCEYYEFGENSFLSKSIILILVLIILIIPVNKINRNTKKFIKTH
jgi:O-antigen/teichoic acid export membrane protein